MVFCRSALLLWSGLIACSVAATGCADPQGDFDAFGERYASIHGTTTSNTDPGACNLPAADTIDGDYLLAFSVFINPPKPVLFRAGVTSAAAGDGVSLSMTLQALSKFDRKSPVGEEASVGPFEVGADGAFAMDLPPLVVVADANPVTNAEITADVILTGSLCADKLTCGALGGMASGISIEGSNFTLQKIEDPAAYPEPLINCAGDPAGPPSEPAN